jgi:hypothetical protein
MFCVYLTVDKIGAAKKGTMMGTKNVSKRNDVRSKISAIVSSRWRAYREDGSWYWRHV